MDCLGGAAVATYNSQDGDTALICAAHYGHVDCVTLLVECGADKEANNGVR